MAKKKEEDSSLLVDAAEGIGRAVGKVASLTGLASTEAPAKATKSSKTAKLAPKKKARLPRREKKAQKKKAAARG